MVRIDKLGSIRYFNEQNHYHREDGPAIEHPNGYKAWHINGMRHRIDGPAIEFNSYKEYYIMDKRHSYEDWLMVKDFPLLW